MRSELQSNLDLVKHFLQSAVGILLISQGAQSFTRLSSSSVIKLSQHLLECSQLVLGKFLTQDTEVCKQLNEHLLEIAVLSLEQQL